MDANKTNLHRGAGTMSAATDYTTAELDAPCMCRHAMYLHDDGAEACAALECGCQQFERGHSRADGGTFDPAPSPAPADGERECNVSCAEHAAGCDGYCDHGAGHTNGCLSTTPRTIAGEGK